METKARILLTYITLIVVSSYFLFLGLVQARPFLAPLSAAALLAMVMVPVCRWMESKGINRGWASFFSDFIILSFFVLMVGIIATQAKSLVDRWPTIKHKLAPKVDQFQNFIAYRTGYSVEQQNQEIKKQLPDFLLKDKEETEEENTTENHEIGKDEVEDSEKKPGNSAAEASIVTKAGTFLGKFFSFLGDFMITFIYIFFFLLYRKKFRVAILKMVPNDKKEVAKHIISESTKVSQNYLFGRLLLIIFLVVLYAIGLSVSGVDQAILISILAAVLSLLPYIGNVIGYVLAVSLALFSGAGFGGVIGVSITFTITQFVESYILEPYIVGDQVDLNPIFTIVVVVLGGVIWGIMGMLVAIPALGIVKVVFDHVPVLQPIGYLFGEADKEDNKQDKDNIFRRTKRWAKNKFKNVPEIKL